MAYNSRSPARVDVQSTHPLYRMRSEGQLKHTPERNLHRLRSFGQLSPPPDWPLPPIPLRSSSHPASRTYAPPTPSNSRSSSSSYRSQDDEIESSRGSGCNTMVIQDQFDQRKIEFTLHRNSKRTPILEDLSQLLYLRGRLQEMGTTFTTDGEMYTYGNPPLNSELEQMLRLGAMYDERWNMFFNNGNAGETDSELWPDIKLFKKTLQNEGIMFDSRHKRINYGTAHPKLIRLADQYDLLYEGWFAAMLQEVHPAQRYEHRQSPGAMQTPQTPTNLGWNFALDGESEEEDELARRSRRLTIVLEEQASVDNGPGPTLEAAGTDSSPSVILGTLHVGESKQKQDVKMVGAGRTKKSRGLRNWLRAVLWREKERR